MDAEDKNGPGLRFPPPLLVIAVIACSWLVERLRPLPIADSAGLWPGGAALIAIAGIIALIALLQFFKAETQIEPWHPTTTIIRHGLYRFSRNPIYLAFCLATLGTGLVLNSWWIVAGIVPLAALLQRLVIRREETYLARKFGADYLDYKRRVRRWL